MNIKELGQKIKQTDYKKMFGTKTFLIVCCVVLVAVSLLVASLIDVQTNGQQTGKDESDSKTLGNTILTDTMSGDDLKDAIADGEDYFAVSAINRQKTRDEALSLLKAIAEDPDSMPDAAAEALASINAMAKQMDAEADIEALVKAKGFEDCVAVVGDDACTVIVRSDGLVTEQVAQILEIAMQASGLPASGITVIEK